MYDKNCEHCECEVACCFCESDGAFCPADFDEEFEPGYNPLESICPCDECEGVFVDDEEFDK
jgi:hypothetical protein